MVKSTSFLLERTHYSLPGRVTPSTSGSCPGCSPFFQAGRKGARLLFPWRDSALLRENSGTDARVWACHPGPRRRLPARMELSRLPQEGTGCREMCLLGGRVFACSRVTLASGLAPASRRGKWLCCRLSDNHFALVDSLVLKPFGCFSGESLTPQAIQK